MTTLSVAVCAYNGQTYISNQLASLVAQTCSPLEIIVLDDVSEDDTCRIIQSFTYSSPYLVRTQRNSEHLGAAANFARAVSLCSGDIIALCDQDDIWLPYKSAMMTSVLEEHSDAVAAFSDAQVVDSDLRPLGYTMWQHIDFTSTRQRLIQEDRPWDVLFKDPVVTGATLMFRRELLPYILPIPDGWMHDAWIAQIAASQGRLIAVPEPLILYRQHAGNVIGGKKISFSEQVRRAEALGRIGLVHRELKRYSALRDRLASFPATPRRDVMLRMAGEKLAHLERRNRLSENRLFRWPTVLREYLNGNYRRFAKDWRNVGADLFMP